jgi:Zn-finger nucleic acid-binding protein
MPLLLCPNDNSSMQTVHRSGVEFEMCPTCRGVWLDRGELEKMMEQAMYSRPIDPPPPQPGYAPPPQPGYAPQYQQRPPEPRYDERYRDSRHHRWDDDDYRKKKRKGLDIFDIFD